jgi:hypothetical protein
MVLAVKAWRLREAARNAMAAGEFARSRELAGKAQATQSSEEGEALYRLGEWLAATG